MNRGSPKSEICARSPAGIENAMMPVMRGVHPGSDVEFEIVAAGIAQKKHGETTAVAAREKSSRASHSARLERGGQREVAREWQIAQR